MPPVKTPTQERDQYFRADRAAPPPPPAGAPKPPKFLPAGGPTVPPILDRSASYRSPPQAPKSKPLDRANTTRAPTSKASPPNALPMTKTPSNPGTAKHLHQGPVAAQPLARAPTSKKDQAAQQGQPRRRDKAKENEDVVRQLQSICTPGDPNLVYRSLQKIGQG